METNNLLKSRITALQLEIDQLKLSRNRAIEGKSVCMDYINHNYIHELDNEWSSIIYLNLTDQKIQQKQDEFINMTSHELKTPLTSIKMSLQLISRLIKSGLKTTKKVTELVAIAEKQTLKLDLAVCTLLTSTEIKHN